MADENGTPSDPRTVSDLEFIYVAGAVRLGARPTDARSEFRAATAEVERAAAARALEEAAHELDTYDQSFGSENLPPVGDGWTNDIGYYGESAWLRARAAEIREGKDE